MKRAVPIFLLCVSVAVTAWASQPRARDNALTQAPVVCPLAESVRVGVYSWPASQVMTGVLSSLLELAYGCPVEVLEGLPSSLELALVRGEIHMLIGVSSVSAGTPLREALAAGNVATANVLYRQQAGFFISETVYASLAEGQVSELAQRLLLSVPSADASDATSTAVLSADVLSADVLGADVLSDDVLSDDVSVANPAAPDAAAGIALRTAESTPETTGETNTVAGAATTNASGEVTATEVASNPEGDTSTTEASTDATNVTSATSTTSAVADGAQEAVSVATAADLLPEAFVNCPPQWQCHEINISKLTAYGFDMSVATPESAAAVVATLQTAQRNQQPWFGFLWTPSWLVPTFSLVRLAEPPYSDACWQADDRACAYPADEVLALWRPEFAAQLPEDMRVLLEQMQFENVLSELLAVQQQAMSNATDATTEDAINTAVAHFLRNYPQQWQAWLEPAVAARVNNALQSSVPNADAQTTTDQDATDTAATNNEDTSSDAAGNANEDTAD